jgi:hypothetical protein
VLKLSILNVFRRDESVQSIEFFSTARLFGERDLADLLGNGRGSILWIWLVIQRRRIRLQKFPKSQQRFGEQSQLPDQSLRPSYAELLGEFLQR